MVNEQSKDGKEKEPKEVSLTPEAPSKGSEQVKKVLEGAEELLTEWANALDENAFASPEGMRNVNEIESDAAKHWLQTTVGALPKAKTAFKAAEKFRDLAEKRNVIVKENFKLEEKNEIILGTFLSHDCPYKKCCSTRKKEGKKFLCFRSTPFTIAIQLMTNQNYKTEVLSEQTNPGSVCIIQALPSQISFRVGLSFKLSKGTVKIHDLDAEKVGVDLIDTVVVKPSRKEIADKKVTLMSYTQTKYPPGMVLMNVSDAKTLGLEEKDEVFISKAGGGEEATLVETEKYESKPGEYEIPGLEISEEEEKAFKGKTKEPATEGKGIFEKEKLPEDQAEAEAHKENELRDKGEEMAKDLSKPPPEASEEPVKEEKVEEEEKVVEAPKKPTSWECEKCSKKFKSKEEAVEHEKVCSQEEPVSTEEIETETEEKDWTAEGSGEKPVEEPTEEEVPKKKQKPQPKKAAAKEPAEKNDPKKKKKAEKDFEDQIDALRSS